MKRAFARRALVFSGLRFAVMRGVVAAEARPAGGQGLVVVGVVLTIDI